MSGVAPVIPRIKFTNASGTPIAGGKVTVYYAGTTTVAPTYQDKDLTVANTSEITLDANGEALFWLNEAHSYKFLVKDSGGATVSGWPVDNVRGAGGVTSGVSDITVDRFSGTGAQTQFTLSTTPANGENSTEVYVSGVYIQKNAYSLAGDVLTFAVAPAAGTNNIEVNTFGFTDYPAAATAVAASQAAAALSQSAAADSASSAATSAAAAADSATAADASADAAANSESQAAAIVLGNFLQAGTGAVARTYSSKVRESISAADFGATGDGVTDDTAAIQAAINYAIANGTHRVNIGPGTFLVNGTIKIHSASYQALELCGATGQFIGVTKLQHHSSQKTNPLLSIQGTRSVIVRDIAFYGNNVAPTDLAQLGDGTYVNSDPNDWVSSGIQTARYAPYCGIAIDPLTGSDPGAGSNYTHASYGQNSSSKVLIERCRIMNFLVGVAVGPRNSDSGTEDIVVRDCTFIENKYGMITTASQQRSIISQDCNMGGHWCNYDSATFGQQTAQPIQIRGGLINKSYRLFQTKGDIGVLDVQDLYCESVSSIGIIGSASSSAVLPASFRSCNFSLIGLDDDGTVTNKDATLKTNVPVNFTGCNFVSQFQMTLQPAHPVTFDTCSFKCENSATDTTPGERENFGVHVPEGKEHLILMRGCTQHTYAGTTKLLDTEPRVYTMPTRAYIMPHTQRIVQATNFTTYKRSAPAFTRSATISGITYVNAETVTFTHSTSPSVIMAGDVLDWRVNLPVVPGASAETAILPALRVTGIVGTTVTCKVTGNIDTTYSPATVAVRVRHFFNGTTASGDTTNGNADILNVTSATSKFQVGDWIYFADTGVSAVPVRISGVSGTTVTCDRTLSKTTTTNLYNTLLTAL